MSRIEYNNKIKKIRAGAKDIEEAILNGEEDGEELQIRLGIVNQKVLDVKQLSSVKNIPLTYREKRALSAVKPLAIESLEQLQEKEEMKEKQKQAKSLIRRLNQDKVQREFKNKQRMEIKFKKMEEDSKAAMGELLRKREDREVARKQKNDEIKMKIMERSEKIRQDHIEATFEYERVVKNKQSVLHKKWENKFQSEYEMPLLEERKMRLEQVRSLRKPIMSSGIGEHKEFYKQ